MGFFNFNKKKKFVSKLSIDQQDEILITLILMKQMIDADGIEKPEEKDYLKNYLLNCGITSKEELESILDSAAKLTSEQYDLIVNDFDEFQKLTILQELYGIICSDNEINHKEVVLLFRISRDMGIDDDIVVDAFGANKDLLEKYIESNKVSDSISEKFENKTDTKEKDIQTIIQDAKAIIEKLKNNELDIRVSQGESLLCQFQLNEEFKGYAETDEFKEHSKSYGETEEFDYSYDNDIERYVSNPELYSSLKTFSGWLELWQVFKVTNDAFIEHINHFIESVKEDYEYYGQYESVKDYLEGGIDWMGIYGSLPYSEHTLGVDGPKLKDCFIGFLFEENKGYEPKIEFIDMSNERINHSLNDLKDIDNILDFTDVRKLIIQLKENKTPIKLRSIWRNYFYFQFKNDEIDEFKNESDVPALDYYTERYGSAEHYDKNKSLHANWISYIEEIEIDYNEFLKRSFIEDYIESCEKNINVDDYYSTELNFSFEDYINWTTEEDLFFDGVAPGWLKSPEKDLIAPPKHNEDDLTKIYELNYKYFDEVINFCYAEVDIKDQSHVFVFDEGKFCKNEIIVSSNKKLRDELNKFKLTEIKSFSVDILFDKWTFFEEINYRGNFKGFDFTLNGGTAIKWTKHKGCYKNELDDFLKDIKNKDISELDFHGLNYDCDDSDEDYDYNFYNKIIWDDNTPEEIIKDVEKNYSENEYEKLRDEIELEEDYLEIELLQKKGFINQIDINFSFENETMNLKWIKKEDD